MRLDGGKLKETQVRLFLSSRAEMQEVIETARQTTLSLMQLQRQAQQQPQIAVTATPQSPPQQQPPKVVPPPILSSIHPQLQAMTTTTQLPGMLARQLYPMTNQMPPKPFVDATLSTKSDKPRNKRRSRSTSRSRSGSRSRSRSHSRDRYRRRSRSPRSRGNKGRSHRDRSDSRDHDGTRSRRMRPSRFDNDSNRSSAADSTTIAAASTATGLNALYQQNAAFSTNANLQPFLPQIDPNLLSVAQPPQSNLSAFSTNDVRKMIPLAFSQLLAQQQQQQTQPSAATLNTNAFSSFPSTISAQQQLANVVNPLAFSFGAGTTAMPSNVNQNHCIRIRNICNQTNYSIIRKFFYGLLIPNDGIKIIHDNDGNRTGNAYVRFVRPTNVAQAIARGHQQRLGRNIVQIEELADAVFDDAIDAYRPRRDGRYNNNNDRDRDRDRGRNRIQDPRQRRGGRGNGNYSDSNDAYDNDDRDDGSSKDQSDNDHDNDVMCISDSNDSKETMFTTVLIEDLPPFTKEQDIMKMFSSYPLLHIIMAKKPKMFSSYVKFHSAEDARAAVKDTACHKISFKTVYVSPCSDQEYETARKEFSGELELDLNAHKSDAHLDLSNEIKSPDSRGDQSQDNDNGDDRRSFDGNSGSNFSDPRINARNSDPRTRNLPSNDSPGPLGAFSGTEAAVNGGTELPVCCVLIENMEYRTTELEVTQWLQGNQLQPVRVQLLVNNRNQTNGECFVQFADSETATQALELHQTRFKSRNVRVTLATWQQVHDTMKNIHEVLLANGFNGINTSNDQYRRFNQNNTKPNTRNNQRSNNRNNYDRCVVALSNVPYKANIDDILDFFADFDIAPENVIRRYNDDGKATGDARICFKSPIEARRAVEQKDNCRIMSRPIYLSIL